MSEMATDSPKRWWMALTLLLLVGASLRWFGFPKHDEFRDIDESGYVQSSLALAEGMVPTFKASPAGPQIWLGWGYVMAETLKHLIHPTPEESAAPLAMRPYVALNHALWDCYYDMSALRRFEIHVIAVLAIIAIIPAFLLGRKLSGFPGAILLGGLAAGMPLLVDASLQSRPYSMAWSFGLFSLYFTVRGAPAGKWLAAAIFCGCAIASRIEMICILPFVLAEHALASERAGKWRRLTSLTALSALIAIAFSPWFFVGFMGSLKTIVAVRVLGGGSGAPGIVQGIIDLIWWQGMAIPLLLLLAGIFAPLPVENRHRRWLALLAALMLTATSLRPAVGAHHQGVFILLAMVYGGIGLSTSVFSRRTYIVTAPSLIAALIPTIVLILHHQRSYAHIGIADWIEQHVPVGTRVYWAAGVPGKIAPTRESGDAIWSEVTDVNAWERKLAWGTQRLGVEAAYLPRALSFDIMAKDMGINRRWFILAGRGNAPVKRYDLRLFGNSEVFFQYDVAEEFRRTGGVIASLEPFPQLGEPAAKWEHNGRTIGVIYCSPDLLAKLYSPPQASTQPTSRAQ